MKLRRMIIGLSLLVVLTGCSFAGSQASHDLQIVVLWHTLHGAQEKALHALSDNFNQAHPAGPVLLVERQENSYAKLTATSPVHYPDLIVISPAELEQYATLTANTPRLSLPANLQRDLLPMAAELYQHEGELRAFPLGLTTYLLYYNQEWIKDLGYAVEEATLTDLQQAACAATDIQEGQIGLGIPAQPGALLSLLAADNQPLTDENNQYQLRNRVEEELTTSMHNLLRQGCGRFYELSQKGIVQFSNSKMALLLASSQQYREIEEAIGTKRDFSINTMALPGQAGPGATLWHGPALFSLAPAGKRHQAAQTVATWLLSAEAQTLWSKQTQYLPVRRSLLVNRLAERETSAVEQSLIQLLLTSADEEKWVPWPPRTREATCRAALVRGLFDLNTDKSSPELLEAVERACNEELLTP